MAGPSKCSSLPSCAGGRTCLPSPAPAGPARALGWPLVAASTAPRARIILTPPLGPHGKAHACPRPPRATARNPQGVLCGGVHCPRAGGDPPVLWADLPIRQEVTVQEAEQRLQHVMRCQRQQAHRVGGIRQTGVETAGWPAGASTGAGSCLSCDLAWWAAASARACGCAVSPGWAGAALDRSGAPVHILHHFLSSMPVNVLNGSCAAGGGKAALWCHHPVRRVAGAPNVCAPETLVAKPIGCA